jgi:hypothetical protein
VQQRCLSCLPRVILVERGCFSSEAVLLQICPGKVRRLVVMLVAGVMIVKPNQCTALTCAARCRLDMYLQRRYEADIADGQPLAKAATTPPEVTHELMDGCAAPMDVQAAASAPKLPRCTQDEVSLAGPLQSSATDLVKGGIAPAETQAVSSPVAIAEQPPTASAVGIKAPSLAGCSTVQPLAVDAVEPWDAPASGPQHEATKEWVAGLETALVAEDTVLTVQAKASPEVVDEKAMSSTAMLSRGHVPMASRDHTARAVTAGERHEGSGDHAKSRCALYIPCLPLSCCPGLGFRNAVGGCMVAWHWACICACGPTCVCAATGAPHWRPRLHSFPPQTPQLAPTLLPRGHRRCSLGQESGAQGTCSHEVTSPLPCSTLPR